MCTVEGRVEQSWVQSGASPHIIAAAASRQRQAGRYEARWARVHDFGLTPKVANLGLLHRSAEILDAILEEEGVDEALQHVAVILREHLDFLEL